MPPGYYIRKLYPVKDKVLKILERAEGEFYLSGGTALSRDESKDIADIISIASHFTFSWQELIYKAKQKDLWVDELEISRVLDNFQLDRLHEIYWVQEPAMEKLKNQLRQIARDILEGKINQPGKNL